MKVLNVFRIISISNALVERFCNHVKLIRIPLRNKLQNRTLEAVMMSKFVVMSDFKPRRRMLIAHSSGDKDAEA